MKSFFSANCLLILAILLSLCVPNSQAENCPFIDGNTCTDCIPVTLGTYVGTTADKTGTEDDTSCTDGDVIDAWHCFTPSTTGAYRVSLCNSDFDTSLAIYSDCDNSEFACNDDACGRPGLPPFQSELLWTAITGETYYLRVSGYVGAVGDYTLTLESPPPATNGGPECVSCTPIIDGVFVGSNDFTDDRWYCYTATCNGRVRASTCEQTGFDTVITVFDACGGNVVAFDDDACGIVNRGSIVEWFAEPSATYFIQVAGFNGLTGQFQLTVDCDACLEDPTGDFNDDGLVNGRDLPGFMAALMQVEDSNGLLCRGDFDGSGEVDPPDISAMATKLLRSGIPVSEGDTCSDCIEVTDGLYTGTIVDNTGFKDDTDCADGDRIDEWLCFTPDISGTAVAGLCQSRFDTTLAVFKQCGGELIACNDDLCGPLGLPAWASGLSWTLVAGERYLLRISGYLDATGDYTLLLNTLDDTNEDPPDGSTCERKLPLADGATLGASEFTPNGVLWYDYSATCFGRATIRTCAAASFDTILTVFDGCDGGVLAQDDDACGIQDRGSIVSWFVRPGATYPVRVSGFNGATGTFVVDVSCTPCFDEPTGDFNDDERLDSRDLAGFLDALLTGACDAAARCAGDYDRSGQIDEADIAPLVDSLITQS